MSAGHGVPHPLVRVELAAALVVVARADAVVPTSTRPSVGRDPSGHDVEHRRLAGTVRSDDARAVRADRAAAPRRWNSMRPVAEPMAHAVQLDDAVPQSGGAGVQRQVTRPGRCLGPTLDDLRGRLDPGLGLGGAGRRTPAQPGELGPGEVLAPVLGLGRLLLPTGPALQVGVVAAVVHIAGAAIELQDPGGDAVQEVAVVGDQDQASAVLGQPVLEPGDRVDVEVVGRLVQDQQVGTGHQRPGQGHPLGLPTRQRRRRRVEQRAQTQPIGHGRRFPVLGPVAAGQRVADARPAQHAGPVPGQRPGRPDRAARSRPRARSSPDMMDNKRRLAAAVETDDPPPVTFGHGQRDVREERSTGAAGGDAVDVEEDHRSNVGAVPVTAPSDG